MPSAGAFLQTFEPNDPCEALGGPAVTTAVDASAGSSVGWWKEPTKEQWLAWVAAWLGWTLDAFDFHHVPADHGADFAGVSCPFDMSGCG